MGNREVELTELFRGSKSRNKVSVGEPAEGSLTNPSRCCLDVATVKHRALAAEDGRPWRCAAGIKLDAALKSVGITIAPPTGPQRVSLIFSFCVNIFNTWCHFDAMCRLKNLTTSDGGSLGSCIDEERSKLRYLV